MILLWKLKRALRRLGWRLAPRNRLGRQVVPGLPATRGLIGRNRYGTFSIPEGTMHRPCAETILSGEVWEAETIRLIEASVGSGDIIHAGTFFGDFLPALGAATTGIVWAFEPVPESYLHARWTIHLNGLENVRLQNLALGEEAGHVPFVTTEADGTKRGGRSRVVQDGTVEPTATEPIQVVCSPLDQLIPAARGIDLIHLDVERYEAFVLRGARRILADHRPVLVLEILPKKWLETEGKELGYAVTEQVDGNHVLRASDQPRG